MTSGVDDVLRERGAKYGGIPFSTRAGIAVAIKDVITAQKVVHLNDSQREALSMIAHKIARICAGNPSNVDSWLDIAGYADLVARELQGRPTGSIDAPAPEAFEEVPLDGRPLVSLGPVRFPVPPGATSVTLEIFGGGGGRASGEAGQDGSVSIGTHDGSAGGGQDPDPRARPVADRPDAGVRFMPESMLAALYAACTGVECTVPPTDCAATLDDLIALFDDALDATADRPLPLALRDRFFTLRRKVCG